MSCDRMSESDPWASYQILKMPGTFSPAPLVSDPDMHHGTCVTHVLGCMPGSLTNSFLWSRWRGKRSRHSWRMCNPQFCITGKRSMERNISGFTSASWDSKMAASAGRGMKLLFWSVQFGLLMDSQSVQYTWICLEIHIICTYERIWPGEI